jgi:ABC-three component (ABC-3C) system Middle Component 3
VRSSRSDESRSLAAAQYRGTDAPQPGVCGSRHRQRGKRLCIGSGEGLPFPLIFLAAPAALHAETRRALPTSIRTSLTAWALQHPYLRESLGVRARAVAPAVREGLLFAVKGGGASIDDEGRIESLTQRRPRRPVDSDEVQLILSRAKFVGRWFAHAGDVATIYAIWGVRP